MIKKEKFVRIYPGVRPDQDEFAKAEAKKLKVGQGEMHRIIIDFYITNHNKIKHE